MNRHVVGLVLAALTFGAVLWLWPRGPSDPEAQVRKLVADVVAGVEARDLGAFSDALADNFRGPQGASKQDVKQIVAAQVLRNRETVAVFNPSLDVTIKSPEDAEIVGTFLFARTKVQSVEQLQPEAVAAAYRIVASLNRFTGEWKFSSATYEQITWP